MSEAVVLDASALAALVLGEPGEKRVRDVVEDSVVSAVSLAEVLVVMERKGLTHQLASALVAALPIKIVAADSAIAHRAARLSSATRQGGLSLGDCFCLATAQHLGAAAMTADRAWSRLRLGIPVTVIR